MCENEAFRKLSCFDFPICFRKLSSFEIFPILRNRNFPNLKSFLSLPGILVTSGILKRVGNLVQPGILFVLGMENWSSKNYEA